MRLERNFPMFLLITIYAWGIVRVKTMVHKQDMLMNINFPAEWSS